MLVAEPGRVKLAVRGVSKSFRLRSSKIEAVRDVSFDVVENEICVLLGPSGCGKSTVLRMIAGLEQLGAGDIVMDGRAIDGPGRDRGMVFQSYTSFDWLTVQRNVEYGLKINGVPSVERRKRAAALIELVHLERFRDAYPAQLSGGMKQRVAIARTLANEPAILLMDEPFGALDAETRFHMQELLMQIMARARVTVVMVTHDIDEALFLADRIIFMSRRPGRVREELRMELKGGKRFDNKDVVIALPGYTELNLHIREMMREESFETDVGDEA